MTSAIRQQLMQAHGLPHWVQKVRETFDLDDAGNSVLVLNITVASAEDAVLDKARELLKAELILIDALHDASPGLPTPYFRYKRGR